MENNKFLESVAELFAASHWFDAQFYADKYADVSLYPYGVARHFVDHGATELREPKWGSPLPLIRAAFSEMLAAKLLAGYETDDNTSFFHWMLSNIKILGAFKEAYVDVQPNTTALLANYQRTEIFLGTASDRRCAEATLSDGHQLIALLTVILDQKRALALLKQSKAMVAKVGTRNIDLIRRSGLFDADFYNQHNQDVFAAALDPLEHYLHHGFLENRDPSARFSTEFYRANNFDVKTSGVNPLLHYILFGADERRNTVPATIGFARAVKAVPNGVRAQSALLSSLLAIATVDKKVEVVSFDFFDTLVERRLPDPHAVFTIMQDAPALAASGVTNFRTLRVEAERIARGRRRTEVTLAQIYEELANISRLPRERMTVLMELEKATELDSLIPRPLGALLLAHVRACGQKIVITSDFYMGAAFLRQVMKKNRMVYDDLSFFVSSEIGKTKHAGGLFGHIASQLGVKKCQILHIGDNLHSDYEMPLSLGLRACFVPASDQLVATRSSIDTCVVETGAGPMHPYSSMALSGYRAKALPFIASGVTEAAEFGYKILGPVVASFMQLVDSVVAGQQNDQVAFLSRDTKLVFDAFVRRNAAARTLPKLSYMLVSRQAVLGASALDIASMERVIERDYGQLSFRDVLQDRFLFDQSDLAQVLRKNRWLTSAPYFDTKGTAAETLSQFKQYGAKLFPSILAVVQRRRAAYGAYLDGHFKGSRKPLIVDIGYRGSTQIELAENFGIPLNAAYLMTWPESEQVSRRGLACWALVPAHTDLQRRLTETVSLLELVLSDPNAPSLRYFESDRGAPVPIFGANSLDNGQRHYLNMAHRAALEYICDMAELPGLQSRGVDDAARVFEPLVRFFRRPPADFRRNFGAAVFEDDFGGTRQAILPQVQGSALA